MTVPNLFLPGFPKSATTTLADILSSHEDIYAGLQKEPAFFSRNRNFEKGTDFYSGFYPDSEGAKYVLDGSQTYLPIPEVAPRIRETLGEALRFIVVLRDPVDRAVSGFRWVRRKNTLEVKRAFNDVLPEKLNEMNLDELIEYEYESTGKAIEKGLIIPRLHSSAGGELVDVDEIWMKYLFPFNYFCTSRYSYLLEVFFECFPRENFLFVTFDQVTGEPEDALRKVSAFLDIPLEGFSLRSAHSNDSLRYRSILFEAAARLKPLLAPFAPKALKEKMKDFEKSRLMYKPVDEISPETLQRLREIFLPEIEKTEQLTGLDLDAWKVVSAQ